MIPERCNYCKGNLEKGKTEFIAHVGDEVIVVRDIPAYVCNQCGEAYFTPEISRKIDKIVWKMSTRAESVAGRLRQAKLC